MPTPLRSGWSSRSLSEHIEPFRRLLLAAFDSNPQPWTHEDQAVTDALLEVAGPFPPFDNSRAVEASLPSTEEPMQSPKKPGQLLFLPPITRGGQKQIPAFTWTCDFTMEPPMVRLFLALFQLIPEDRQQRPADRLQALALRFDMPEQLGGESASHSADDSSDEEVNAQTRTDHDYPHVQLGRVLVRSMDGQGKDWPLIVPAVSDVSLCPEWLPDSFPAFPLPVQTPADLVFSMLLSLYGRRGRQCSDLFQDPEVLSVSRTMADRMVLRVPPDAPSAAGF